MVCLKPYVLGQCIILLDMIISIHSALLEAQLASKALEYGAPFAQTSLQRFHTNVFGKGRAARASDIVIFNKSDKTFKLKENDCVMGGWTNEKLPEHIILPHTSSLYGAESYGFMTGYKCSVTYNSDDSTSTFTLETCNPYWSKNKATGVGTGVEVLTILGKGTYNTVQFIIE